MKRNQSQIVADNNRKMQMLSLELQSLRERNQQLEFAAQYADTAEKDKAILNLTQELESLRSARTAQN